jgi:phage protein D
VPRVPYFSVRVAEADVDVTPWVNSVTVVEDDKQADNVTLTIPDPRLTYADALFEGSVVEVDMGYAEPDEHALMIRALITKVDLAYPDNGVPSLTLKGEDLSIHMGLVERKAVWRNMTVTSIVRRVVSDGGYPFSRVEASLTPDPQVRAEPINQDGKTDLAFLQELAKTYHAKCFVELDEQDNEVLYFIPERRILRLRRPEQLVLRYRTGPNSNLTSFSPSFDSSYIDRWNEITDLDTDGKPVQTGDQPQVETVMWELDETLTAQASSADQDLIRRLYSAGAQQKEELQQQFTSTRPAVGAVAVERGEIDATADQLESRRLGMSASGSTVGTIWLRAKSKVTVMGVNSRFAGEWYVPSVTHKIDANGSYRTDFKCVR